MKSIHFSIEYGVLVLHIIYSAVTGQLLLDRAVTCQSNDMRVSLDFRGPFSGVVYAEKFYQSRECNWEGNGSGTIVLSIPLNTNPASQPYCGVELKDETGEFAVSLIMSPIRNLLVEGMEKLTVRCLYSIGDVTLTLPAGANGAGIFISPQTQGSVVTGSGGSPFLQMAIRDGHGINGDIVQSATVGQRITLDVIMQDTTIYDFWVHDCYAHDGTNSPEASVAIIDTNGCVVRLARAVDPPVFDTAPNPNGAKHVYAHMYGFQFTTSQLVYFECQVRPCLQSCNRPQCNRPGGEAPASARRRRRETATVFEISPLPLRNVALRQTAGLNDDGAPDNYNLTAVIRIEPQNLDAFTPVARDDPGVNRARLGPQLCVHTNVAIAVLAIFVVVCVVSLFIAVYMCHRARSETKSSSRRVMSYSSGSICHSVLGRHAHASPSPTTNTAASRRTSPASLASSAASPQSPNLRFFGEASNGGDGGPASSSRGFSSTGSRGSHSHHRGF